MAISPLRPAASLGSPAPKLQSQTDKASATSGMEIAEQLNLETKRRYQKDRKLGEGTYAIVYLGHHRDNPASKVAIKKIKVNTDYKDGLSMDAIREVKFLQELSHPNIIALHSVFSSKNQNLNLVLEYLPLGDLEMLIRDAEGVPYGSADIKAWMAMLCRGIWYCHDNFVLHRDIKPNNLLIAADGEIKLADFGLARSFSDPYRPMTSVVITRWYRPPELFFGAKFYSGAVDMWSVGLVFAELILRTPFVAGISDVQQLELICKALGTPTEENWPGVSKLPHYFLSGEGPDGKKDPKAEITPLPTRDFFMSLFGTVGPTGVDLLMAMLKLDPRKRATAQQALQHSWWTAEPKPTKKEDLPRKREKEGASKMGEDMAKGPGQAESLDPEREKRLKGVARRLDFGAKR